MERQPQPQQQQQQPPLAEEEIKDGVDERREEGKPAVVVVPCEPPEELSLSVSSPLAKLRSPRLPLASSTRCRCCQGVMLHLVGDRPTVYAMALMAASAFAYSLQSASVKKAGENHAIWTIAFFRGVVGAVISLGTALLSCDRRGSIWGRDPSNLKWLMLRATLGAVTVITGFLAVLKLDLSDATVLCATAPLWTAILAVFCERGSWSGGDTVAALLCLSGIVLVAKPPPLFDTPQDKDKTELLQGVVCALVSAMSQAGVNMTIRRIKQEDTSVITLYAMVGCIMVSFPGMVHEQMKDPQSSLLHMAPVTLLPLFALGILSYGSQVFKTWALKISQGVGVLVMRYLETLFSFIWQIVMFHVKVDHISVGGAVLIIAGCVMSIVAKLMGGMIPNPFALVTRTLSRSVTRSGPSPERKAVGPGWAPSWARGQGATPVGGLEEGALRLQKLELTLTGGVA